MRIGDPLGRGDDRLVVDGMQPVEFVELLLLLVGQVDQDHKGNQDQVGHNVKYIFKVIHLVRRPLDDLCLPLY